MLYLSLVLWLVWISFELSYGGDKYLMIDWWNDSLFNLDLDCCGFL